MSRVVEDSLLECSEDLPEHTSITVNDPSSYLDTRVTGELWKEKLHGSGCAEIELPARCYKLVKILSVGPKAGEQTYGRISIAVDYV